MKIKFTIAVALFLLFCLLPLAGSAVEQFDTPSPINLTVGFYIDDDFADSALRQKIETAFAYMNFFVQEMTNGAHRLGQIRIMNQPRLRPHIRWRPELSPSYAEVEILGTAHLGGHIPHGQFGDYAPDGRLPSFAGHISISHNRRGIDISDALWPRFVGGTLAHEAGHFIYGLGDEYSRDGFGEVPVHTIMRGSVAAIRSGNLGALNFSTAYHYRPINGQVPNTHQISLHGKSAWETLLSDVSNHRDTRQRSRFMDLEGVAPPLNAPVQPSNSSIAPRPVDVHWGLPNRARIYLLDRSGSMEGARFDQSIRALAHQIARASNGTHIAVYAFDTRNINFVPFTEIPEGSGAEGRNAKRRMIDDLVAAARQYEVGGGTALYASMNAMIQRLNNYMNGINMGNDTRIISLGDMFVFSDGEDNSSGNVTLEQVIEASRRHFIPIHVRGIGMQNGGPLERMFRNFTRDVGGAFGGTSYRLFNSRGPFLNTVDGSLMSDRGGVISHFNYVWGRSRALRSENDVRFFIDRSLVDFSVFITHRNAGDDMEFTLISPANVEYPVELLYFHEEFGIGSGFLANFTTDESMFGEWTLRQVNNTVSNIFVQIEVWGESITTAEAQNDIVHSVTVGQSIHNLINLAEDAPRTIHFVTRYGGEYLTNLNIEATVQNAAGHSFTLNPRDDGIYPDLVAGDGIYTATIPSNLTGRYSLISRINNRDGQAHTTNLQRHSIRIPEGIDIDGPSPFFGEPIKENFERTATIIYYVTREPAHANNRLFSSTNSSLDNFQIGRIDGVEQMLLGIEKEFNVNFYPQEMGDLLRNHISWNFDAGNDARITTDPNRPGVVRVRFDSHNFNANLSISNTIPNALRGLIVPQTQSIRLVTTEPRFLSSGFNNQTGNITILEGEEAFYNMTLVLPRGYDDSATWSITADPNNAGQIVSQSREGVTFRTLRPGRFTMTLSSDVWPELINRSVEVHSVFREGPGTQHGRPGDNAFRPDPIPCNPDPGGDDDVRTRPGTGSGSGGGPNRELEYQDPPNPVILPPELSRVTLGGRDITDDGVRVIRQWESVSLVLEFKEAIDRYMLSAALTSGSNLMYGAASATSVIDNIELSEDGKTLAYVFMGKVPGQHRVFFSVERRDGIEADGSFVLHVQPSYGGQGGSEENEQGSGGSGGCNVGAGVLAAMLVLAAAAWKMRKVL